MYSKEFKTDIGQPNIFNSKFVFLFINNTLMKN